MLDRPLRIPAPSGELAGILRKTIERAPTVVLCHDLHASKDDLLVAYLWQQLAFAGYNTLRFDFSHHGESGNDFSKALFSDMVRDTIAVVQFCKTSVVLLGHGLGGNVAVAAATRGIAFKGICTINTPANLRNYAASFCTADQLLEWRKTGQTLLLSQYPLRKSFLDDIEKQDTITDLRKLSCPLLFCQGTADRRILPDNARQLYGAARERQLAFFDGADHDFRAARQQLVQSIIDWLRRLR